MLTSPEKSDESAGLFKRDGLYHVRLFLPESEDPIEVALHGITSEQHACSVLHALTEAYDPVHQAATPKVKGCGTAPTNF